MVKIKFEKKNKVRISLTIFVIALCFYLIYYYSGKETKLETELPSEIIPVEEPAATPGIPITTTIEKQTPTKFISGLKCVNSNIMMTFTNILRDKKKISDFTFLIAGKPNRNPDCDLKQLNPGESTFCQNLDGGIKFRKKVEIAVTYPGHNEKAVADCSKSQITTNVVRDIKEFFIKLFGIS